MRDDGIATIKAREILDSKGRPMVEVDVWTTGGKMGRAASPCGTSVGRHEAFVLRDGGRRFGGLGVQQAVRNVTETISPALFGKSVFDQRAIDLLMIELDGTSNKSRLGANTIYSVSVAVARAASNVLGLPLYRYLGGIGVHLVPVPMFNMVNGGPYSHGHAEFQEFLLVPGCAKSYSEALRMGVEVFYVLGATIKKRYGQEGFRLGASAGYAAPASEPAEIIETLLEATEQAGYRGLFKVGLDCAASHFYNEEKGFYRFKEREIRRDEMIQYLEGLVESYPLFYIEDPLQEDDFEGHSEITKRLKILIVGDDLYVTSLQRLKKGTSMGAGNGMILKPNMVGTLTEALETARYAKEHGYCVIPSCRGGGSVDDPIPEVAVAINAPLMKVGAPQTGERTAYQNQLLRIEEELGEGVSFNIPDFLKT